VTVSQDHQVELWTSQGDKQTRMASKAEAERLEVEPLRPGSNIDSARVTPPKGS
jgi:hypothetical protein